MFIYNRYNPLCSSVQLIDTLVPEVFLDFSPLERREPRSGDRYYDIMSRESAREPLRDS